MYLAVAVFFKLKPFMLTSILLFANFREDGLEAATYLYALKRSFTLFAPEKCFMYLKNW